jgi:hypothetical protein
MRIFQWNAGIGDALDLFVPILRWLDLIMRNRTLKQATRPEVHGYDGVRTGFDPDSYVSMRLPGCGTS